jgi:hypothetical protein
MTLFPKATKTLVQLIGPTILFVALSMSGGELLIWPDLIGKYGLGIIIILPIILVLQASVNLEIERYTLATGKPALESIGHTFTTLRPIFIFTIFISLVWPAWVLTAANVIGVLIGVPAYSTYFGIVLLLLIILIWFIPGSYELMEKIAKFGLLIVLIVAIVGIPILYSLTSQLPNFGANFDLKPNDKFLFLSALAYGGVSGILNFVQSSWIINKQYGINSLPKEEHEHVDWNNSETKSNWHQWWTLILREHLILYIGGNIIGIVLLGLIASYTVANKGLSGFAILAEQIKVFMNINPIMGWLWGIGVMIVFIMAQMTILDAAGHLIKQVLPKHNRIHSITPAKYSQLVGLGGVLILMLSTIIPNFTQPAFLLQVSALLSAIFMIFYPPILIWLNDKHLPEYARGKKNRILVYGCSLFYLVFVLLTFFG